MGLRGFPPAPTAIKVLKGNPGRRPLPKAEPKPEKGAPTCPQWLDTTAKVEWHRIVPMLDKMGLLTKIDRSALALYCDAWSQLLAARRILKEQGMSYKLESGYIQQRPEVSMYHKLQAIVKGWCHEFGLTPSARGRMTANPHEEEVDPFEQFLNGNRDN